MKEGGPEVQDKVTYAFQLSTSRRPTEHESGILINVFHTLLKDFQSNAAAVDDLLGVGGFEHDPSLDRTELAAWSAVANMLLNLDETISKS
jgi:hypothetical protein